MDNSAQQKNIPKQIIDLEEKVKNTKLPQELNDKASTMIDRLKLIAKESNFIQEYDHTARYINWITTLPWFNASKDILDLTHARQVFDERHYGLKEVKQAILEYLSVMIMQEKNDPGTSDHFSRAPIIALVGLVGVGKTTIAYSIAEALGRKVVRIPFGGMGKAAMLRGESRFSPDAEPGLIIKAMQRAGTNNPVLLLDEIDRVSAEARADIMGVLIELLDPEQNKNFSDHYIDHPFDLSNVLFVATSNNTKNISTAVLDRLEIIQMPSYSDDEKIVIAKKYLFPKIVKDASIEAKNLIIDEEVWPEIVRPLGYDSGIRSLKRAVQGLVRRVALFTLEGKIKKDQPFHVNKQNLKYFISQW